MPIHVKYLFRNVVNTAMCIESHKRDYALDIICSDFFIW